MLNLAWLLHRNSFHTGPDRHALALPLWLRAAERNYSEGALLAGHAYQQGDRLGLPGGESSMEGWPANGDSARGLFAGKPGPRHIRAACWWAGLRASRLHVAAHEHMRCPFSPAGANLTAAVGLHRQAAAAGSAEGLFSLGRMHELGRGLERNASEAARLYRLAIAAAPSQAFAAAPSLALHWLRLRLLLAPLLRVAQRLLLVWGSFAGAGRGVEAPGTGRHGAHSYGQQLRQRASGLAPAAQWDSLLIVALVGALTWVLWRRRQLQQRTGPAAAQGRPRAQHLVAQQREADHPTGAAQQRRQQQSEHCQT